jgi:hypothetical protein
VYSSYLRHGTHVIVAGNDALYVGVRNDPDAGIGVVGSAAPACPGDCDESGIVAINELITGVRIILGEALISACASLDTDKQRHPRDRRADPRRPLLAGRLRLDSFARDKVPSPSGRGSG